MANDFQRLVRRDVLAKLKGNSALIAIVPAASIYGQAPAAEPVWPFIKLGPIQELPRRASCLNGADVNFGIHAFSRGRWTAPVPPRQLLEIAEDHASRIGTAIKATLDRGASDLPGVGRVRYLLADRNLMVDAGEPDAFHWYATVQARVIA